MATMRLEIVTAERRVYSEDVDMLVAPGIDGQLGILPNHAPLLTALQPGEIRVDKDGEESYMAVSGGFLEVLANRVTILADTAERAEEIDIERAEAAVRRAQERIAGRASDRDMQRAVMSLRRSQARLIAARRRRPRRGVGAPPPSQPS
ncbi:MAG: F0F1 ATP synthase subunit epsilon [Chloroflexi bacterium]|nr:F0F1 ATP synthase subunit epsilon [Chloroflexota bacterium]